MRVNASQGFLLTWMIVVVVVLSACSTGQATYFRKYQATQEDERAAWGLCGGGFMPDGQVSPSFDNRLITCMREKGFQTINEYYEENYVMWISQHDPFGTRMQSIVAEQCGLRKMPDDSSCRGTLYVLEKDHPKVSECLGRYGYVPSLPRLGYGHRLVESHENLSRLSCYYRTPKNNKGGISFGKYRVE